MAGPRSRRNPRLYNRGCTLLTAHMCISPWQPMQGWRLRIVRGEPRHVLDQDLPDEGEEADGAPGPRASPAANPSDARHPSSRLLARHRPAALARRPTHPTSIPAPGLTCTSPAARSSATASALAGRLGARRGWNEERRRNSGTGTDTERARPATWPPCGLAGGGTCGWAALLGHEI